MSNASRIYIRGRLINTAGVFIHEIGGTDNHIHLAISIAPTILISDLVGKLKGASSHDINQRLGAGRKILEWQPGYGVVSFGTKELPWVVQYIQEQRDRHGRREIEDRLERITALESEAKAEPREAP